MKLLTKAIEKKLIKQSGDASDKPYLKLFAPWGAATWLISEYDPETKIMFGLCDLGLGSPELGYVSLDELEGVRGFGGLSIERDLIFEPEMTLAEYASEARKNGRIDA